MHILFVGYSQLIQRKILPFIHLIPEIKKVDIAKFYTQTNDSVDYTNFKGQIFNNYEEALENSKANLAYVSVVNSAHAEWAEKALKKGMHVIVDKPACLSYSSSKQIVDLAKELNLCIAEAIVYPYHSQIEKVNEIMLKENLYPMHLTLNFSFPPLSPENFRYKTELGGGALFDLGPYTISPGRIFFNENPQEIFVSINSYDNKKELETSFSILAKYSKGRSMIGNFGFNTEYINRIIVLGKDFSFEINRAFTPPSDMENEIIFKHKNNWHTIKTEKSNCFINYIQYFINKVKKSEFKEFSDDLLNDSQGLEMLRKTALKK